MYFVTFHYYQRLPSDTMSHHVICGRGEPKDSQCSLTSPPSMTLYTTPSEDRIWGGSSERHREGPRHQSSQLLNIRKICIKQKLPWKIDRVDIWMSHMRGKLTQHWTVYIPITKRYVLRRIEPCLFVASHWYTAESANSTSLSINVLFVILRRGSSSTSTQTLRKQREDRGVEEVKKKQS